MFEYYWLNVFFAISLLPPRVIYHCYCCYRCFVASFLREMCVCVCGWKTSKFNFPWLIWKFHFFAASFPLSTCLTASYQISSLKGKREAYIDNDSDNDKMEDMEIDRELSRRELINSKVCELYSNLTFPLSNSSSSSSFDYELFPKNTSDAVYVLTSVGYHFQRLHELENFHNISNNDKRFHHNLKIILAKCEKGNDDDGNIGLRYVVFFYVFSCGCYTYCRGDWNLIKIVVKFYFYDAALQIKILWSFESEKEKERERAWISL